MAGQRPFRGSSVAAESGRIGWRGWPAPPGPGPSPASALPSSTVFIITSRSAVSWKKGNRMPIPRSKPSITTYIMTPNRMMTAQINGRSTPISRLLCCGGKRSHRLARLARAAGPRAVAGLSSSELDGVHHHVAVGRVLEEGKQDADTQVEAVHHDIHHDAEQNDDGPDQWQVNAHFEAPLLRRKAVASAGAAGPRRRAPGRRRP